MKCSCNLYILHNECMTPYSYIIYKGAHLARTNSTMTLVHLITCPEIQGASSGPWFSYPDKFFLPNSALAVFSLDWRPCSCAKYIHTYYYIFCIKNGLLKNWMNSQQQELGRETRRHMTLRGRKLFSYCCWFGGWAHVKGWIGQAGIY